MEPVDIRINPGLDLAAHARTYAARGIVRISALLEERAANAVGDLLQRGLPWRILFTDADDRPAHFSPDELRSQGPERWKATLTDVLDRARRNRGFFYKTYPMIEAYLKGWDKGHPIHQLTEFVNSADFLGLGRAVTGIGEITKADAHATAYGPGDFLTRHLDYGEDRERRAAYVLGFTRDWQPDWGGLLLFLNEDQDVTGGYLPRFNTLTIFDIKYLHTVTQVSTFAGAWRYSITGWFRDDPVKPAGPD
jgi:Rps23 Pro-64 3,4-dihydroxylase Tpa1-like proline 4-hydroxylase